MLINPLLEFKHSLSQFKTTAMYARARFRGDMSNEVTGLQPSPFIPQEITDFNEKSFGEQWEHGHSILSEDSYLKILNMQTEAQGRVRKSTTKMMMVLGEED